MGGSQIGVLEGATATSTRVSLMVTRTTGASGGAGGSATNGNPGTAGATGESTDHKKLP